MKAAETFRTAFEEKLRTGCWRAGEKLPTERQFGEDFGVSRSTVRRVLGELKKRNLIRQLVGSGTYVSDDIARLLGGDVAREDAAATSPADLMEARLVLEPAIVELVVGKGTQADFARMLVCCEKAEAATSLEEFEHWDGMLHEVISEAAHNDFFLNVFRLMNQARAQGEWGLLKKRSVTPERRLAYQAEHRKIVEALRDRDASGAKQATLAHLVHVRRNLLGI